MIALHLPNGPNLKERKYLSQKNHNNNYFICGTKELAAKKIIYWYHLIPPDPLPAKHRRNFPNLHPSTKLSTPRSSLPIQLPLPPPSPSPRNHLPLPSPQKSQLFLLPPHNPPPPLRQQPLRPPLLPSSLLPRHNLSPILLVRLQPAAVPQDGKVTGLSWAGRGRRNWSAWCCGGGWSAGTRTTAAHRW